MSEPLLKVENLVQHFPVSRTYTVKAVNGGGESAGASITVYTKSGYFEYKPLIESANFP